MKILFAAVGLELRDAYERASKNREKNLLFSFYDMTYSGFKFRLRHWEHITEERYVWNPQVLIYGKIYKPRKVRNAD
jgi:hypothetical protein